VPDTDTVNDTTSPARTSGPVLPPNGVADRVMEGAIVSEHQTA